MVLKTLKSEINTIVDFTVCWEHLKQTKEENTKTFFHVVIDYLQCFPLVYFSLLKYCQHMSTQHHQIHVALLSRHFFSKIPSFTPVT